MSGLARIARVALPLLAAALFAGGTAAPAAAAAEITRLKVLESLRPVDGRASEVIVTGRARELTFAGMDSLEIDLPRRMVVVRAAAKETFTPAETSFAFSLELPSLPANSYDLVLFLSLPGGGAPIADLTSFAVHPSPSSVEVQQDALGVTRVRIQGAASSASLAGAPFLEGRTIKVPVAIGCDNDCGGAYFGAAPSGGDLSPWAFDLLSQPIGPLPAGRYTLELVQEPWVFSRAKLVWREEVDLLQGEVALRDGRFGIAIDLDAAGEARLVKAPSADAALFYFFAAQNWEAMVKVLDGCAINRHFWVFAAASTDVGYTLRVSDREGGIAREYRHEPGTPAPAVTDIEAFPCD